MNNKQENVVSMIASFGKLLLNMPEGILKKEFSAFIYQLTFGSKSLAEILEMIEQHIAKASSTRHQDMQVDAKSTVKFWKNIQDILVQTHEANKNE